MPEIKNTFLGGKMNKDLDERLLPEGQYRDAQNVEIATAEDSSVGTVRNILGNKRLDAIVTSDFTCVGTVADEKNNKLYWFVSTYLKDAILEYDIVNDTVLPVVVDKNASNSKAVLRFGVTPIITGINIIDNLLLWTDNITDPKKINIDECKKGTPDFDTHTQLKFESGSFSAVTLENVSNSAAANDFLEFKPLKGKYFWFAIKQMAKTLGIINFTSSNENHFVRHYRNGRFLGRIEMTLFGLGTGNGSSGRRITGQTSNDDFHVGDILYGDDVSIDIEERHVTVVKPKPLVAPSVKINYNHTLDTSSGLPNLFETKFPRFSYRYKFRDGEFSTFAPFTSAVFNPRFPKDLNNSTEGSVFYNKDNAFDIKDPSNKAMINSIQSIGLSGFITSKTPEDVVEIDILYKQENSSIIYSVKTIKHTDKEWHALGSTEGYDLGYNQDDNGDNFAAQGGYTKGKYVVTTENIYAALPANQLLRPWDNVPRRALAQEVTGNRIVYGNYLQNYNLGSYNLNAKVSYSDRNNQVGSFETQGLPSIKSQRNYQLGVVLCDEHGRETPVLTSDGGALNIPWSTGGGLKNASRSLQLNASVSTSFPEWVDSMKFFIKETSNEYYNLIMSRAWVTEKTYELDNSEGHIWISFPSSDRNKVAEGEYLILKKKVGVGESQIEQENKFKIIDISNEAPDAIKYELINQGVVDNTADALTDGANLPFMDDTSLRIDLVDGNDLYFDKNGWSYSGVKGIPLEEGNNSNQRRIEIKNLYVSWRRITNDGLASQKYKIESGRYNGTGYVLKLKDKITQIDADVAHINGLASITNTQANLHPDLIFQIEQKVLKTGEDFSGSFFVKISKNQITDLIESGNPVGVMDNYQVSSKKPTYYFRDDVGSTAKASSASYGLTNFNAANSGTITDLDNSIQNAANNDVGEAQVGIYPSAAMHVTDHAAAWDGILLKHGRTFFIDAMHMASGQSEASNYAKYNCVTWSGAGDGDAAGVDSAWSYPPLKVWLTDFEKSAELLESIEAAADNTDDVATGLYYDNKLLSTSPMVGDDASWNEKKVDGWVGPAQVVDRQLFTDFLKNHVNGLEGLVTTVDDHATGPRRWLSGITGSPTNYGAGVDTKTYSGDGELGRYFLHVSFLAPGEDLHDGATPNDYDLFGDDAIGNTLQGIWGGGHFTGPTLATIYGNGSIKHSHICLEGNNDTNNNYLPKTPGPGVGFGYDLNYKEKHYRQWDPTFPSDPRNETRNFLRNLHPGAQFKFLNPIKSLNKTVYTIKSVSTKKLYNHTNWRTPYNRYKDATDAYVWEQNAAYKSVEENAIAWLKQVDDAGVGATNGFTAGSVQKKLLDKIKDFGKASNRRVCYIIELDKDPAAAGNYNPIAQSDDCTADKVNENFCNIEFLDKVKSVFLSDLSKFPAIWETDPVKQEVDLDIYFEASNNIPVKLNNKTNEILAPLGSKVEILNSTVASTCRLLEWDGSSATLTPGFPLWDGANEVNYSGVSFKFTKQDGSFVIIKAGENALIGAISTSGNKQTFNFESKIGENIRVGLAWNNCFSFGNGLESNRIRDDFNNTYLINGVKASTTIQKTYEEERRSTGMIYSGLYNSNSGVNDLNQFIMAEKITKDLNPTFGSIQKLFQRRISLVAFCEDKVVSITSNKDAIYNADGNPQLISSNNVLGDANPFEGNYGISKNPESFASESYRAYFTDKNRGAVVRLSKDGLTPISSNGMSDFFRDNLKGYSSLIGTYDAYKQDYNLTLSHGFGENIIFNSFLESGGVVSADEAGSVANIIKNSGIYYGTNLQYPHEQDNILTNNNYLWGSGNENLLSTVMVTNHAEILEGSLQPYVSAITPQAQVDEVITITPGAELTAGGYTGAYVSGGDAIYSAIVTTSTGNNDEVIYAAPQYGVGSGGYSTDGEVSLPDSGNIYYPEDFYTPSGLSGYNHSSNNLFGGYQDTDSDDNIYSRVRRRISQSWVTETGLVNSSYNHMNTTRTPFVYGMIGDWGANDPFANNRILQNHENGNILFNRMIQTTNTPGEHWVEFRELGSNDGLSTQDGELMYAYNAAANVSGSEPHAAMYAGDEIEIRVEIKVWDTNTGSFSNSGGTQSGWGNDYSYNKIQPFIQITDGTQAIVTGNLQQAYTGGVGQVGATQVNITPVNYNFYWQNWSIASTSYETGGTSAGDGIAFSTDKFYSAGGSDDAQYVFPTTTTTDNGGTMGSPFTETYTLFIRYKFKSSAQTYSDSTDFVDEKIVSDLRIRVGNNLKNSTGIYPNGPYGDSNHSQAQKWEISSLKVRKLLGIVSPDTEAVAETFTDVVTGGDITGYTPVVNAWVDATYAPDVSTVTTSFAAAVAGVAEVIAVPPQDVDAWTQVRHDGINEWTEDGDGTSTSWPEIETNSGFGNNYPGSPAIGYAQNFVDTTGDSGAGLPIYYFVPTGNPPSNATYSAGNPYPNALADGDGTSDSGLLITDYDNAYIKIETLANEHVGFTDYIPLSPWEDGKWYLVDVEYDSNAYPNAGDGTANNGFVIINGVADLSGTQGNDIDSDSFGKFAGSPTNMGVRLLPTTRTEYGSPDGSGDNKSVLRGIFQFSANSWRSESGYEDRKNTFRINFWDFVNFMQVEKIISRKLEVVTTTGEADSWYHDTEVQAHSLSPQTMYWSSDGASDKANTLCFEETTATGAGSNSYWGQGFTSGNGPLTSAEGWNLKFTVTENPRTDTFEGNLSMYVNTELDIANDPASTTPMSLGILVTGITAVGDYEVDFNFETDTTSWTVTEPSGGTNTTITVHPSPTSSSVDNKIVFYTASGVKTICGIKNVFLGDETLVLLGGTVASWSWQGFNDSNNNFITWEDTVDLVTSVQENRILFTNCPAIDPNSTLDQNIQISASQYIDTPVNRYEHYTVSVDHGINTGELSMYYFNADGFGFRIDLVDNKNIYNVIIGDEEWSGINPADASYSPEMKETFVIRPHNASADVNGWIDNITMTRNYVTEVTQNTDPNGLHYVSNILDAGLPVMQAKTISFSEKVNGWTSFKSFVLENGVSLSSSYFTFKQGGLYKHYVPLAYDDNTGSWVDSTSALAKNYNRFYDITTNNNSSLKAVLNEQPSDIKIFDTINYEGSQAYVPVITNTYDPSVSYNATELTILNTQAWGNNTDIDGWKCIDITTNLEAGSIKNFIQKEGKWFGYIKGNALGAKLDTTRFSVQGLGEAAAVTSTPITV